MKLNDLFSDGMVFQAGKPVRIFGTGGGFLKIEFCGNIYKDEIVAADWTVEFPPMPYGGPYEMHVDLDGRIKTITDIYVGDVYLIAGQSNMQFKLRESNHPVELRKTIPSLRLFTLERMECGEIYYPDDGWVSCTKENAANWSAIGYIMGAEIAEKHDHAIGLVACYQGAAAIQSYLPEYVFEDRSLVIPEEERYDIGCPWNKGYSVLYNYMFRKIVPFSFKAVVWYQGESNCSKKESAIYGRLLNLFIDAWRKDLLDSKLPFVLVRIADYIPRRGEAWDAIRKAQDEAGCRDDVYTVICDDVSENDLIHPVSKTVLSERIADILMKL